MGGEKVDGPGQRPWSGRTTLKAYQDVGVDGLGKPVKKGRG
ncbi:MULTISPECIES: hypothetical protein [Streptomyces]|nr:hypothetical protein [Streptomyces sp. NEAU-HV9]